MKFLIFYPRKNVVLSDLARDCKFLWCHFQRLNVFSFVWCIIKVKEWWWRAKGSRQSFTRGNFGWVLQWVWHIPQEFSGIHHLNHAKNFPPFVTISPSGWIPSLAVFWNHLDGLTGERHFVRFVEWIRSPIFLLNVE